MEQNSKNPEEMGGGGGGGGVDQRSYRLLFLE